MANNAPRYPFAPVDTGAFFFLTDKGCYYTIAIDNTHDRFKNDTLVHNNGDSFEISVNRSCDDEKGNAYDDSVSSTIIHILTSNIESKGDTATFFFVCDTSDGLGLFRNRKFNMWFESVKKALPALEKHNFILKGQDEEQFNISLLIFNNHPYKEEYKIQFEKCLTSQYGKS